MFTWRAKASVLPLGESVYNVQWNDNAFLKSTQIWNLHTQNSMNLVEIETVKIYIYIDNKKLYVA